MCTEPSGDLLRAWLGPDSDSPSDPSGSGRPDGPGLMRDVGGWVGTCRQDDDKVGPRLTSLLAAMAVIFHRCDAAFGGAGRGSGDGR